MDKKKILFYNDKTALMPIDEEFQKLWRSVPVDGIDDNKIEEYLMHQGIRSMQDTSQKVLPSKLKRKAAPKKRTFKRPRDNEHLKEILEEYEWSVEFLCELPCSESLSWLTFLFHIWTSNPWTEICVLVWLCEIKIVQCKQSSLIIKSSKEEFCNRASVFKSTNALLQLPDSYR